MSEKPRRRGRPPRLDVDMIVDAAIEKTRSVGLDRFSMKELAASLNAGEMSIYHHVPTRFELDRLVVRKVAESFELPDPPPVGGERSWLEDAARCMRLSFDEYPGTAQHVLTHGPSGSMLQSMQSIVSVLSSCGIERDRLARSYSILTTSIVAFCVQRTALARADGDEAPFRHFRDELGAANSDIADMSGEFSGQMDDFFDDAVRTILKGLLS